MRSQVLIQTIGEIRGHVWLEAQKELGEYIAQWQAKYNAISPNGSIASKHSYQKPPTPQT